MKTFKEYVTEATDGKNTHMTHLSDLVFIGGVDGTRKAVNYLRDMRNMFGHTSNNTYTVKWDGAPAIVCGIDPQDGKFFVAKKGIFNATPKVYKNQADIDADLSGELKDKFTILLQYLPTLGIKKGIYQGDLMFTKSDLKRETIDGQDMIVFHPNTIAYAIPVESALAKKLMQAEVGMVFHTTYTGDSFAELKATFGKNITDKFAKTSKVWTVDATLDNKTADFTLTNQEYLYSELLLKDIGVQFRYLNANLLNAFHRDGELMDLVLIYINSLVRKNQRIAPLQMAAGFQQFIHDRYEKDIDSKKMEKSKETLRGKRSRVMEFFSKYDQSQFASIFDLAVSIDALKDLMLTKMRKVSGVEHFLKTKDGFKVTNPEGFVAINSNSGEAVKLVDRFTFSQANFSADIMKGWQR